MKPYGGCYLENSKRTFNYRLSRARRVSENTLTTSAARWRNLVRPIDTMPKHCIDITRGVVALQDWLIFHESSLARDERRYIPLAYVMQKLYNGNIVHGGWRGDVMKDTGRLSLPLSNTSNACKTIARKVEDCFKSFFNSPQGSVPWQNDYLSKVCVCRL